jgi:hypothetical protein
MIINIIERNGLWRNALIALVAHATMVRKFPSLDYEISWDEITFLSDDGQGTKMAISFKDDVATIAIQSVSYSRSKNQEEALNLYQGLTKSIETILKTETHQYLLSDGEDGDFPTVSTGFWANTDNAVSKLEVADLLMIGGAFLKGLLLGKNESYEFWFNYYEADEKEKVVIVELVELLLGRFGSEITLGVEYNWLLEGVSSN